MSMKTIKKFQSIRLATRALIFINAAFWLGFAVLTALGLHPGLPEGALYRWGMTSLAFLTAVFLVGLFLVLDRFKLAYYLLLAMLAGICVLTITDDFGFSDLVVLVLHLAAFAFLIISRRAAPAQNATTRTH